MLRDAASVKANEKELLTYPKGARQFFIAELFPGTMEPARSVKRIATDEGLAGIEVEADGCWRHSVAPKRLPRPLICAMARRRFPSPPMLISHSRRKRNGPASAQTGTVKADRNSEEEQQAYP